MLGKVMKHDFRANGRLLLPLCGLGLASSAIVRLLIWMSPMLWQPIQQAVGVAAVSMGVLVILAVISLSMVIVVYRFYQTFASNQGYLTFSLPVSVGTQLASRLLVSVICMAASAVVAFLCASIIIPDFWGVVAELAAAISAEQLWGVISLGLLMFCVMGLIAIAVSQLRIYLSIAIGTQFGRHRIIGSVVGYFILNTIEGIVSTALLSALLMGIFGNIDASYFNGLFQGSIIDSAYSLLGVFATIFGISAAVSIIVGFAEFIATRHIFTKRINLE